MHQIVGYRVGTTDPSVELKNKMRSRVSPAKRFPITMYSPQVLDHFEHPRNPGAVARPDASVQLENPVCGDVLMLTVKIADDSIDDIRFLARGCVCSMACGSALTELVKGKTIGQARALTLEELIAVVGTLPPASTHAAHLAMEALAAALDQLGEPR